MDIGRERDKIHVEPLEEPFPARQPEHDRPEPAREPACDPVTAPDHDLIPA
jgi:hypothetical protein